MVHFEKSLEVPIGPWKEAAEHGVREGASATLDAVGGQRQAASPGDGGGRATGRTVVRMSIFVGLSFCWVSKGHQKDTPTFLGVPLF